MKRVADLHSKEWVCNAVEVEQEGKVLWKDTGKTYSESASLVDPLNFAYPSSWVGCTAVEDFAELPNLCESSCSVEIRPQLEHEFGDGSTH